MDHQKAIDAGITAGDPHHAIARKIFLTYPTHAFAGAEEQQFEVLNAVSSFFEVPIVTVQVVGSAKTGRSFHKKKDFEPGISDLDIAIVDSRLFVKYAEIVFDRSRGFSDQTQFPIRNGRSTYQDYVSYFSRGIFRPDLMTVGTERAAWNNFFGTLSRKHTRLFARISASIYLSEFFFERKQRSAIKSYLENKAV